jgi:polar amino acid transport system substrate-binding protein
MRKFIGLGLFLVLVLGFSGLAMAQDADVAKQSTLNEILKRGELLVGLEAGYMPFEMRNKKGDIIGFDVDIAGKMAEAMGVKLKLINTAWDGIIPALITKKFDIIMSGMTIKAERNLKVNFCEPYIVVGQAALLHPKHKDVVKSYKDLNDPKYTISVKLGTTGDFAVQKFMPKANRVAFEDEQVCVQEVIQEKADAHVYDLPQCANYYAKYPGKFIFLDEPFTYEPLGWAVRKGDPDFINWLNNFLRQIKGDGTYDDLYNKWFKSKEWLNELQ